MITTAQPEWPHQRLRVVHRHLATATPVRVGRRCARLRPPGARGARFVESRPRCTVALTSSSEGMRDMRNPPWKGWPLRAWRHPGCGILALQRVLARFRRCARCSGARASHRSAEGSTACVRRTGNSRRLAVVESHIHATAARSGPPPESSARARRSQVVSVERQPSTDGRSGSIDRHADFRPISSRRPGAARDRRPGPVLRSTRALPPGPAPAACACAAQRAGGHHQGETLALQLSACPRAGNGAATQPARAPRVDPQTLAAKAQRFGLVQQGRGRQFAQQALVQQQHQAGVATWMRVAHLVVLAAVEQQHLAGIGHGRIRTDMAHIAAAIGEHQVGLVEVSASPRCSGGRTVHVEHATASFSAGLTWKAARRLDGTTAAGYACGSGRR